MAELFTRIHSEVYLPEYSTAGSLLSIALPVLVKMCFFMPNIEHRYGLGPFPILPMLAILEHIEEAQGGI